MKELLAEGRISRWRGIGEIEIKDVSVKNKVGQGASVLKAGEPISIELGFEANNKGKFPCCFVILVFSEDGRWVTRHFSETYLLNLAKGERKTICLRYDELLLGAGKYTFSAAIYKNLDIEDPSSAEFYDLLSRSFKFEVISQIRGDESLLNHPSIWEIKPN